MQLFLEMSITELKIPKMFLVFGAFQLTLFEEKNIDFCRSTAFWALLKVLSDTCYVILISDSVVLHARSALCMKIRSSFLSSCLLELFVNVFDYYNVSGMERTVIKSIRKYMRINVFALVQRALIG